MPDAEKPRQTSSEIEVRPVYTEADVAGLDLPPTPGEFPFTRGIHPTMRRGRPSGVRRGGTTTESRARLPDSPPEKRGSRYGT